MLAAGKNEIIIFYDQIQINFISVPPNGLMIFCGKVITPEGKEKMVNIDFEPFRAVNAGLYHCDNKFHTAVSSVRCVLVN